MNFKQLCTDLSKYANKQKATEMAHLMGNTYAFKGLDSTARAKVMEDQLASDKEPEKLDWEFVECCWDQNIREFQYFALQYLSARRDLLQKQDLTKLKKLIVDKPGWDTNNILHRLVNLLTALHPDLGAKILAWSQSDDPWLKRAAILHQMDRGIYADEELLAQIWQNCLGDPHDFVQAALVDSLKELHDNKADFVEAFLNQHETELSSSIRQALCPGGCHE